MTNIEELVRQKGELEKKIKEATKSQKAEDLKLVRTLCKRHNFTHSMLKNYLSEGRRRKNGLKE
jgi:hypothetical protein